MSLIFSSFEKKQDNIKSNFNYPEINSITYSIVSNFMKWYDYDGNYYNDYFKVRTSDFFNSQKLRNNTSQTNFNGLYRQLSNYDGDKLDLIYSTLSNIQYHHELNRKSFADVIVSFVQTIPYSFVIQSKCLDLYNSNTKAKLMIDDGTICHGEVLAGVYSPIEFMKTFVGDCDTRTLFLYTIFKKFNYDVVILNSDIYAHSILGLNLPSPGEYKSHLGKRYYTWETTNNGWTLGNVPPSNNNMSYWDVVLSN